MTATTDTDGWTTVGEESGTLVTWEHPGESFTGEFVGTRHIVPPDAKSEDDEFDQQMFRSNEDGTDVGDILYAINGGYKIRDALKPEYEGHLVRIIYVKDVDTGQPSPMKDFKVQVRL
jgi:hypothetical protein